MGHVPRCGLTDSQFPILDSRSLVAAGRRRRRDIPSAARCPSITATNKRGDMGHIDTSEIIRASVWIRPEGDALDRILDVRRRLSMRKRGPEVLPHLTLLSGLETTRADAGLKLKRLAARLRPFTVRLGKIDWKADYFRCLYVA